MPVGLEQLRQAAHYGAAVRRGARRVRPRPRAEAEATPTCTTAAPARCASSAGSRRASRPRGGVRVERRSPEAALNLGNALFKLGGPARRSPPISGARDAAQNYADALRGEALALRALGRLDEAREDFAPPKRSAAAKRSAARGCLDLMLGDFETAGRATRRDGSRARRSARRSASASRLARARAAGRASAGAQRSRTRRHHPVRALFADDGAAGALATFVVPPKLHRLLLAGRRAKLRGGPPKMRRSTRRSPRQLAARFSHPARIRPGGRSLSRAQSRSDSALGAKIGDEGFKIGVVWQGNPDPAADRARSFALTALAPLAGVCWRASHFFAEGLRLGTDCTRAIRHRIARQSFDAGGDAFVDTAAAMASLDLVVSCDTSVAHLAGALARPAWIALKFDAEWRWMRGRNNSPWYPTVRLFRQKPPAIGTACSPRWRRRCRKTSIAHAVIRTGKRGHLRRGHRRGRPIGVECAPLESGRAPGERRSGDLAAQVVVDPETLGEPDIAGQQQAHAAGRTVLDQRLAKKHVVGVNHLGRAQTNAGARLARASLPFPSRRCGACG